MGKPILEQLSTPLQFVTLEDEDRTSTGTSTDTDDIWSSDHEDTGDQQSHLGLLTLPLEIRLLILEQLLYSDKPIRDLIPEGFCQKVKLGQLEKDHICCGSRSKHQQEQHTPSIDSTILRVCRQLYNEGLPMLFDNTFQFTSIMAIEHFQDASAYAFLRPRIRRVELISSIDAFDTPMWHRLAPIRTRIQLSSYQQGLRDDLQPFLAAWASAEAARQSALGPTRYLDSLTIVFRNWSWEQNRDNLPPSFPHSLSQRSQELLLASMASMLRQGYPAKAKTCHIRGLCSASPENRNGLSFQVAYPCLLKRIKERNQRGLTEKEMREEEKYAEIWSAFEESLRQDLLARLQGLQLD